MITIGIPNNNTEEREYVCSILFEEFLGLDYQIQYGTEDYQIRLENGNTLIVQDCFFNKFPNTLEYLKIENIPEQVNYNKNIFLSGNDIPVIYGSNLMEIKCEETKLCICGIDIFASSFFMLTRWEEYVNKNRDIHNRFSALESLAYKNHFLDRSLVNEYVALLWNMLKSLGIDQKRKELRPQLILTHDVDELYMWKSWKHVIRVAAGDILKRRNISLALQRVLEYYFITKGKINDPYDTFDLLMDKSEEIGLKSRFYFMSGGVTKYDHRYKIDECKALELIKKIKRRGHIIGIHPSYSAYNNYELLKKEKELLEEVSGEKIIEGREHYLRFEVPTTWQIFEDNGMVIDSTCGYADKEGFRCGTGDEFSVFNILTRKKLKLRERPLVVMDSSLFEYQNLPYAKAATVLNALQKDTNSFTLLWHNSYTKHMEFYRNYLETKK